MIFKLRYPNDFNLECIKSILKMDKDAVIYVYETSETFKWQAIHYSCTNDKYYNITKFLLLSDRNLEAKTHTGDTPLKIALKYKSIKNINLLLENGAYTDNTNMFGESFEEAFKNCNISDCEYFENIGVSI